jgi:hypothetical protein
LGANVLNANSSGVQNAGVGAFTLQNSTSSNNAGLGYGALASQTSGGSNTAMGYLAAERITTGGSNTAIGSLALNANTTASRNTAVGYVAGTANTTGHITAVGAYVLYGNTTGTSNTAVGGNDESSGAAMQSNTTGNRNTAIGVGALYSNTTGSSNVAIGYQAGYSATTGGYNNVFIGDFAGNSSTGQNNILIGQNSSASSAGVNYELVIGTAAPVGKGGSTGFISPNGGGVYQGNNSSSWSTTSDFRLKKNIVDNTEGLDKITQIRVRNFEYKLPEEVTELDPSCAVDRAGVQLGVIAQELREVCPDCVKEESTGVISVDSDNIFWHMVNAIKDLKAELDTVKAELAALRG